LHKGFLQALNRRYGSKKPGIGQFIGWFGFGISVFFGNRIEGGERLQT